MSGVADFWRPWEQTADSYQAADSLIQKVFDVRGEEGRVFAWRGQTNADWALHSSLYRRLKWTAGDRPAPDERAMHDAEGKVLADLHRWGLHMAEYGRLSVLSQLAVLQHYGAPTRLLDVTFNPWIALWFAVEQKWDNGAPRPDVDARVVAVDVTNRLINDNPSFRRWEDARGRPWVKPPTADSPPEDERAFRQWTSRVWAWRPPHFHPRLSAQNGGFLFSGVPVTGGSTVWPKSTEANATRLNTDAVRQATSVAFRLHKLTDGAGRRADNPAYTFRIEARAVPEIRKRLQGLFGYEHCTIYPDYTGFASYATQYLKSKP